MKSISLVTASPESEIAQAASLDPARLPACDVDGLYVHIPFCFHKCHYCDFYSITRQTPERMSHFVDLLLMEADRWRDLAGGPRVGPRTIFMGGGTPSLLPLQDMRRLVEGLWERFDLSGLEEWTVEVNPATAQLEYCQMLRAAGVDRLSFGAQSFDRAELTMLERHHNPPDVGKSIELARKAGFERLNIDLIYAIPGQSLESWSASLESALALGLFHLSCYNLTYEPNTPMAVRKRLGQFQVVPEETELAMLRHTRQRLRERGLVAYEISNYSAPGEECKHNLGYWMGENYIGLGPSAASHVEGHRWRNRPHLGMWEQAIEQGAMPAADYEILGPRRRAGELAMLMLRLADGIRFAEFSDRSGFDARELFADPIARFEKPGLLSVDHESIRLTERGVELADALASHFLLED